MSNNNKNWKLLSRTLMYDGSPHMKISIDKVKLPNGKIIDNYHRIEINDAVMLLVQNENDELLIYKEYRHGINRESLTFPAGGIEAVTCLMAMRDGIIPPTINNTTPDENCDLDYVTTGARKAELNVCMSNSFGFGGTMVFLSLKKSK